MKIKVVIIILAVACIGLLIGLLASRNQAEAQHQTDVSLTEAFSNQVVTASNREDELGQVNLALSNELSAAQLQLTNGLEQWTQLSNSLASANATITETKAALIGAQEIATNLSIRVVDLEAQNRVLDEQANSLSNLLAKLTLEIEDTRNQLAITRTNAVFLQGELQKQLAQKAELEHKFNDLDELRVQVKKIKEERWYARRALLKNDNDLKKGGELLMSRPTTNARHSANFDLNVEVGSDGSVRVIPPLGSTNLPSH
jgi:chromosome segregation ATPase